MKKIYTLLVMALLAMTGFNAYASIYIVGSNPPGKGWNTNTGTEMTAGDEEGVYTYTFTFTGASSGQNGKTYFVFASGLCSGSSDWTTFNSTYRIGPTTTIDQPVTVGTQTTTQYSGGKDKSYEVTLSGGESYTITFNETEMWFKIAGAVTEETSATYVVAGVESMMGESWAESSTTNQMTKGDDGKYTLTKTDVTLTAGTKYEFKVVKNGSVWYSDPNTTNVNGNYELTVEENGVYTIVFTFDPSTELCTYTLTKTADVENVYTIAGTKNVMGSYWDVADTLNTLAKQVDGTYKLIKRSVTLYPADTCKFKVAVNHSWDLNYGQEGVQGGENYEFTAPEAAVYDVVFTYNDSTHICTWSLTKRNDITVYILGGTGSDWDPTNGMQMTKSGNVYTYTFTPVDAGDTYSYFGFTRLLATSNDSIGWASIAPYRFGPVSEGDFLMTDEMYGIHIDKATDGNYPAIKIPAGEEITVTVSLDSSWIQIDKGCSTLRAVCN